MPLSRPAKILIAALTIWPTVYGFVFVATAGALMFGLVPGWPDAAGAPHGMPTWFAVLFLVHLATMLEAMAMLVFYLVYLFRTDRVPRDERLIWALLLFVGGPIGMPVFFVLHIWPATAARPIMPSSGVAGA